MPDGIAFDSFGNLWCTLVMIDQLIAITPQGDRLMLLDDSTPAGHDLVRAFDAGKANSDMMFAAAGTIPPGWPASRLAAPICVPPTWAACAAPESRFSGRQLRGSRWCTGRARPEHHLACNT